MQVVAALKRFASGKVFPEHVEAWIGPAAHLRRLHMEVDERLRISLLDAATPFAAAMDNLYERVRGLIYPAKSLGSGLKIAHNLRQTLVHLKFEGDFAPWDGWVSGLAHHLVDGFVTKVANAMTAELALIKVYKLMNKDGVWVIEMPSQTHTYTSPSGLPQK